MLFPDKVLAKSRKMGDPLADKVVSALFHQGFNPLKTSSYNDWQYNEQKIPADFPEALKDFIITVKNHEIDGEIVESGSLFYMKYGAPIMLCLGMLSLPYCYAAADGAKVLSFSKRIYEQPEQRLAETAQFVFDVCSPGAFQPNGKAYVSCIKVRLMHAAIRYHLINSNQWDDQWGLPVNQEDMAGTNLSFSLIAIRGLKKLGYEISATEATDYIKYWNEIGFLLGLSFDLMPSDPKSAYILDKKIKQRNFKYSEAGELLASRLKEYISQQDLPFPFPAEVMMAYLLGEEICELIGIPYDSLKVSLVQNIKGITAIKALFDNNPKKNYKALQQQFKEFQPQQPAFQFLQNL